MEQYSANCAVILKRNGKSFPFRLMLPITFAVAVDHNGIWAKVVSFLGNYEQAFPGMDTIAGTARKPFYILALVLLVYQLVKHLSGNGSTSFGSNLRPIARSVAFAACVAFCSPMLNAISTGFDDLGSQMGADASPGKLITSCEEILANYAATSTPAASVGGASAAEPKKIGWLDSLKPGNAIKAGLADTWASIQDLLIKLCQYATTFFYKAAVFVTLVMLLVRYFIVQLSSIFLPAYVAMVSIGALSGIGTRYIMGLIGVLAWPLAWGLSNVGTETLMSAIGTNVIAPTADVYTYIWCSVLLIFIPIWMAFTYVFGPLFIQKMVSAGASAASAMVGGAVGAGISAGAAGAGAAAGLALRGAGAVAEKIAGSGAGTGSQAATSMSASSRSASGNSGGSTPPITGESLAARYAPGGASKSTAEPQGDSGSAANGAPGESSGAEAEPGASSVPKANGRRSIDELARAAAARTLAASTRAGAMAATPFQMLAEAEGTSAPVPSLSGGGISPSSLAARRAMGLYPPPASPSQNAPASARQSPAPRPAAGAAATPPKPNAAPVPPDLI